MQCTWENCSIEGTEFQVDKEGNDWAVLCIGHHKQLEKAIESRDPKTILSCWVKASGGAAKLAEKTMDGLLITLFKKE